MSKYLTFLGLFFLVAPVFAQSDQEIAKKYGITFPIAELGNCVDVASCKTFCDDPKNHQICIDFAKKHNLDKEQIIYMRGKLLPIAGEFSGMKITEAREKIIEKMEFKNF